MLKVQHIFFDGNIEKDVAMGNSTANRELPTEGNTTCFFLEVQFLKITLALLSEQVICTVNIYKCYRISTAPVTNQLKLPSATSKYLT